MSNILLVSDAYAPQVNGVVRTLQTTIKILRARGHHVTMVTPDLFSRTVPLPNYPEIRIPLPPWGIDKLIQKNNFDSIHIATEGVLGWAARRACNKLGLKYTTAYHTKFPEYLKHHVGIPEWIGYRLMRRFHKDSEAIMVPTLSVKAELEKRGFERVVHWGRGVDKSLFHPRDLNGRSGWPGRRPFWLNVGRVAPEKNLDAFLSLDLPGTKVIVGDGPDLDRLKSAFPSALYLGAKHGVELAECFNFADVFVFPSLSDTYGLVVAEAISSGCPVAAFDVTGPKDIVEPGETGVLSDDLRSACLHALYLACHRETVERDFSWDAATDQFLANLYQI